MLLGGAGLLTWAYRRGQLPANRTETEGG